MTQQRATLIFCLFPKYHNVTIKLSQTGKASTYRYDFGYSYVWVLTLKVIELMWTSLKLLSITWYSSSMSAACQQHRLNLTVANPSSIETLRSTSQPLPFCKHNRGKAESTSDQRHRCCVTMSAWLLPLYKTDWSFSQTSAVSSG
jgi:hypothetical protein